MEETRLPEDWQEKYGYRIVDPDGWRNARKPWDEPVTWAEFEQLARGCTVAPLHR